MERKKEMEIIKELYKNTARKHEGWTEEEEKYIFDSIKKEINPMSLMKNFCKKYERTPLSFVVHLKITKKNMIDNKKKIRGISLNQLCSYIAPTNHFYSKKYYHENKELITKKRKEKRYRDMQDPIKTAEIRAYERKRARIWRENNRIDYNRKHREYYHKNKEKYRESRERWKKKRISRTKKLSGLYYLKNREKKIIYIKIWQKNNPEKMKKYNEKIKREYDKKRELRRQEYEKHFNKEVSELEKRLKKGEKIDYLELPDFIGLGLKAKGTSWCSYRLTEILGVTRQNLCLYKNYERHKNKNLKIKTVISPDKLQTLFAIIEIPHLYVDVMENLINYTPQLR